MKRVEYEAKASLLTAKMLRAENDLEDLKNAYLESNGWRNEGGKWVLSYGDRFSRYTTDEAVDIQRNRI